MYLESDIRGGHSFLFVSGHAVQLVGSWFPHQGLNPSPRQWKCEFQPLDGQGFPNSQASMSDGIWEGKAESGN